MAEILIKQVAKTFNDFQALKSIDITIADQEFLVLLGASGCGKTTLLRIIAGLETATTGEVWIKGKRVDQLPPRNRGIAMVFQNYAIFPHMKVFDNIGFGLRMQRLAKQEIRQRVERTAELMHIEQLLHRYSGELSGGQRQRVAVARALTMQPNVILMDEPLSNLDALLRLEMRAELKGVLASSKTTAIYVTHDQIEAMSLADRIAVMHAGQIVQASTPIDVYRNPSTQFVASFIGNPPMNFIQAKSNSKGIWKIGNYKVEGPKTSAAELQFAIRPEDIKLANTGIRATVTLLEPLGAHLLLSCDVAGQLVRAIVDSDLPISVGAVIYLAPQPDRIRWFDNKTGLAIQ